MSLADRLARVDAGRGEWYFAGRGDPLRQPGRGAVRARVGWVDGWRGGRGARAGEKGTPSGAGVASGRAGFAGMLTRTGAAWLAAELNDHVVFQSKLPESEIDSLAAVLTEQRNPRSENLEELTPRALVELFVEEEKSVQDALRGAIADLARAIEIVTESLRNGGRLFYVGAGSSGRIGVLDASEIPPTFGVPPNLVQGVIAGGVTALYRA